MSASIKPEAPAQSVPQATQRVKELDGIRGIAILMVLVWHTLSCYRDDLSPGSVLHYLQMPTRFFWSGVDLFFVLSGFLIGGIILDHHRKPGFLRVFWVRRSCRILPVLTVLLLACWGLRAVLGSDNHPWLFNNLMPWWSYVTFSQNILMSARESFGGHFLAVTWSLAVEEQFYLAAPLIVLWLGAPTAKRLLIPLAITALFLRVAVPGFHTYVTTLFRMDALIMGVCVAVIFRKQSLWSLLEDNRKTLLISFVGLLLTAGILSLRHGFGEFKFTYFSALYALFLTVALLYRNTLLTVPLRSGLLCFWGSIAYGLYMYHEPVNGLLHGWWLGSAPSLKSNLAIAITATGLAVSTLLAWLSLVTIESYFLKIGKQQRYAQPTPLVISVETKLTQPHAPPDTKAA